MLARIFARHHKLKPVTPLESAAQQQRNMILLRHWNAVREGQVDWLVASVLSGIGVPDMDVTLKVYEVAIGSQTIKLATKAAEAMHGRYPDDTPIALDLKRSRYVISPTPSSVPPDRQSLTRVDQCVCNWILVAEDGSGSHQSALASVCNLRARQRLIDRHGNILPISEVNDRRLWELAGCHDAKVRLNKRACERLAEANLLRAELVACGATTEAQLLAVGMCASDEYAVCETSGRVLAVGDGIGGIDRWAILDRHPQEVLKAVRAALQ